MINVHTERRVTYIVLGAIFLGAIIVFALIYDRNKDSREAADKAAQLSAELTAAGLPVPSTEQITNVLGSDGGAVCAAPANALVKSILYGQLSNGAGGPGQRPVVVDDRAVRGTLLIVKVYCPEEAASFQQVVNDLKTADLAS